MEGSTAQRMWSLQTQTPGTSNWAGLLLSSKLGSKGIINVPASLCLGVRATADVWLQERTFPAPQPPFCPRWAAPSMTSCGNVIIPF